MQDPNTHFFEVTIDALDLKPKLDSDTVRFVMPVWTPGSYVVREFSRNVLDFSANDIESGKELRSYKVSKNLWQVELKGGSGSIHIRYRVYAFEFTVDTSYLDNQHAIINGASLFMYIEGMEKENIVLTIFPYLEWKVITTGLDELEQNGSGGKSYLARDFDTLVDSPVEVGNQRVHSFAVNGVKHTVSVFSQKSFDQDSFVTDIKRIVEATIGVFDHVPYASYVFLVDISGDNYGGLEHSNSTHCIAPIFRLEPVQEYKQLLSLFSHEFFHAWNVKRMRPLGLGPFDYSRETYTKSLWIAEGITSYYDDLILRRAGIYSVGEYLDAFCSNINQMKSLPGSRWQSAEEASFDTWIKHYRPNENSSNVLSSYYTQGTIIGWMLDMVIRRSSESAKSIDDVMRKVYRETYLKDNRGYTEEEFEKVCNEIAATSLSNKIFEARVRGRESVDFERYLGQAGLILVPKKTQSSEQGFLGVRVRQDTGRLIVSSVLASSPAELAGVSAQDEIIGVDDIRMDSSRLSWQIANNKPGTSIDILIARFGGITKLKAELQLRPTFEYRIVKKETASQEERNLFEKWLGADWEEEIKYEEYLPSPSKRPIFDYI